MNAIKPLSIFLEYNEFKKLELRSAEKLVLECREGCGWITATNDPNDYFVFEGSVLEFPSEQSGILLQSLSPKLKIDVRKK